ncbi:MULTISPECIES: alkaline phosphatase family protein [unclassified Cyanobium]|uniref:alkaline phosphatase family protein n=1 Tax=unclassified Cyanobium TaxID=2627006 RepID=UPI0020CD7C7D|nr:MULTISPECIES: alkaline phosphatase family protein [unclassified Cyanobium]MCP9834739.1 alkaline phosphatase family protein [Cyanobium sp. La Preciosa 7G6]MCP9937400.1 alkaline phosphatase family protein [Cyanobium sp. Aljojuca 7A6]
MARSKVLVLGLDGYENTLGDAMMAAGELPALAALRVSAAHALLDHGPAQRTGLAWEHVASGLSPEDAGRWSAVGFDPATYRVWQEGTVLTPFPHGLKARTVVFDTPYFDLKRADQVQGLVGWGAHDPGIAPSSRPAALFGEMVDRFGTYPAKEHIYGLPWPCPDRCRRMATGLVEAVQRRADASLWLLQQRCPDWELGVVVVSELHSAIEGLWHGVDPGHPLRDHRSASPAGEGLRQVYQAVDQLVGRFLAAFPEAVVVAFSTGGMGPNHSDVLSMALLSELLHREAFGTPLMGERPDWSGAPDGLPMLAPEDNWHAAMRSLIPTPTAPSPLLGHRIVRRLRSWLPSRFQPSSQGRQPEILTLEWMPATRYQPFWSSMRAFALPSFYDGRIRINLVGRESHGLVQPQDYGAVCDELVALLQECRDPRSGDGIVQAVELPAQGRDPRSLGPTESDLVIIWRGALALSHPRHGTLGPLPYRRTGGHTGTHGMLLLRSQQLAPGDLGLRSTFDVVPTILALLGEAPPRPLSGRSLLPDAVAATSAR